MGTYPSPNTSPLVFARRTGPTQDVVLYLPIPIILYTIT